MPFASLRLLLAFCGLAFAVLTVGCADAESNDDGIRVGQAAALQAGEERATVPAEVLVGIDAILVDDLSARVSTLVAGARDVGQLMGALDDRRLDANAPERTCPASLQLTFLRGGEVVAGASVVCPNVPTPERVTVHFVRPSASTNASPPLDGYTAMDTMALRRALASAAR